MMIIRKLILTIIALTFCVFAFYSTTTNTDKYKIYYVDNTPTHESVKKYIIQLNIKFPEIVYAQTVLETGNFKSNICLNNNNVFGMKLSSTRPTTAICERNGYAYYNTWQESVIDYAFYQAYYFDSVKTVGEYLDKLGNYAEDSLYIKKIVVISRTF